MCALREQTTYTAIPHQQLIVSSLKSMQPSSELQGTATQRQPSDTFLTLFPSYPFPIEPWMLDREQKQESTIQALPPRNTHYQLLPFQQHHLHFPVESMQPASELQATTQRQPSNIFPSHHLPIEPWMLERDQEPECQPTQVPLPAATHDHYYELLSLTQQTLTAKQNTQILHLPTQDDDKSFASTLSSLSLPSLSALEAELVQDHDASTMKLALASTAVTINIATTFNANLLLNESSLSKRELSTDLQPTKLSTVHLLENHHQNNCLESNEHPSEKWKEPLLSLENVEKARTGGAQVDKASLKRKAYDMEFDRDTDGDDHRQSIRSSLQEYDILMHRKVKQKFTR